MLPLLSGCDLAGTAKGLGDYMPTINERCESTECITPSGKAASDAIKAERLRREKLAEKGVSVPAPSTKQAPAKPEANDPFDTTEPF
jgi:hypothetical protein